MYSRCTVHVCIALILLLSACAPTCSPEVAQAGFVARVSRVLPLEVVYQERILLLIQTSDDSYLIAHDGQPITLQHLQQGQRVWLRGNLRDEYPQKIDVAELRLLLE